MKKVLAFLLVFCLCAGSVSLCASAAADAAEGRRRTTLFVRFDGDCVLSGVAKGLSEKNAASRTENSQRAAMQSVQDAVGGADILYTYTQTLNGVAVETKKKNAAVLRDIDGVADVIELGAVRVVREPVVSAAEDMVSGGMIGADEMRARGFDGTGTAVAVIDGGLQWDHPTMRLTDESTAKYTKDDIAKILSASKMNAEGVSADDVYKSAKVPFAYDYNDKDTEVNDADDIAPDHGTHVSGIAAGNSDKLVGIAPQAQVLMFKINVYDEEPFLATLLAAIDDAAKFDIASMNMSVGMDFEMPNDPAHALLCEAIANARSSGILVCAAAGNSALMSDLVEYPDNGTNGIPNAIPDTTSVASVDNLYSQSMDYALEALLYDGGKSVAVLDSLYGFPEEGALAPIRRFGTVGDLHDKIALVYDTNADYEHYLRRLQNKQMRGLIVPESLSELAFELWWTADIPAAVVSNLDAYRLYHSKSQYVTAQFMQYHSTPAEQLQLSYFSSYGVSEDLKMTVDVAAPGDNIISSVTGDKYDLMGGTSMACPHVVGGAALLRQYMQTAYPDVTGKERADLMESLLMSTASPVVTDGAATSPRAVGAGLINVADAAKAQAILVGEDGHTALNIGDGIDDSFKLSFTVRNVSPKPVRYDSLTLDVLTDDSEQIKEFNNLTGETQTQYVLNGKSIGLDYTITDSDMPRSFTLEPGESRRITLTVSLDPAQIAENAEIFTNGFYVEGYAHLQNLRGEAAALSIPFLGFRGDWLQSPALLYSADYPDFYLPDNSYFVMRNLRALRAELLDAEGNVAASAQREWVKKSELLNEEEMLSMIDEKPGEGVYTLRIAAILDVPGAEERPQYYMGSRPVEIDNAPIKILSARSTKDADGTYTLEITTDDDNAAFFELNGRVVLNCLFTDVYPVDGYDRTDADGNFVYVLEGVRYPAEMLVIYTQDTAGNTSRYHLFAPLVLFVRGIVSAFAAIGSKLVEWFGSLYYLLLLAILF